MTTFTWCWCHLMPRKKKILKHNVEKEDLAQNKKCPLFFILFVSIHHNYIWLFTFVFKDNSEHIKLCKPLSLSLSHLHTLSVWHNVYIYILFLIVYYCDLYIFTDLYTNTFTITKSIRHYGPISHQTIQHSWMILYVGKG